MQLKTAVKLVIGTVSYSVWGGVAMFVPTISPALHDFLQFNIVVATGLIGLALRDLPTTSPEKQP